MEWKMLESSLLCYKLLVHYMATDARPVIKTQLITVGFYFCR